MEIKRKSAQNENKFSALISLIKRESIEEIKEILHKWSNLLTLKDRSGRTALHYCSEHSSALCADFILEKCSNLLTTQDNDGYTALHLSVISGNQVITRHLIGKSDTDFINQCDNESHTAVHWATVCGQVECLDLLLNSGAYSSRADIHGAYPLHYSAQMCNPHSGICIGDDPRVGLTVLNRLLHCPDVDVDCVDSDGRTPLLWAASAGSADSLLALINAGANVAAKDKDGLTALHCASSRGHIDCVETLLTLCGSDVNLMDANGCPPLFYAVTLGHADCTRLLIESGANVNAQDFKGRTAAHCGAARGQFETIKILGQQGANLWLRNSRGDLPLHEAVKSGRKELVKWLLDQIPSAVNATNSFGRSALHIAAINNNIEMCKILIDIGADVNTVMKTKGHFITPLDAALQKGYRGVAKYLLLHGALPASRISHSLNKSSTQRYPSGRPMDSFTTFDNNSPIESYDEWRARSQSTDSALHSQSQMNPLESLGTQLPKLPTLVKNGTGEQHIQETSSSTPSSLLDNTNHYKNIREFETPLSDKPSNLKQAIITNVYVTNTPICHSKRVPPLKKLKKRRKTIQDNEEHKGLRLHTPSMSSSSSIINGEENIKVVMETKDDSSFKLRDSSNEKMSFSEKETKDESYESHVERKDQKLNDFKSDDLVSEQHLEESRELHKKEVAKQDVSDSKVDGHEYISISDDKPIKEFKEELKNIKSEEPSNSNNVNVVDSRQITNREMSDKSIKSSELSDKSRSSQKSTQENNRAKRSVSRRRSSVVDINTKTIEKKTDGKQKSENKKSNESEKQQKTLKNSESSTKSSARVSARKDFEDKSIDLAQDIDKQSKAKAKKEFTQKLRKLIVQKAREEKENDKDNNTEETSNSSDNKAKDSKELSKEDKDTDDNKDIDSITYIKSDNESVKSNVSSGNGKETKSEETLLKEEELKEIKSEETHSDEVPFDKSSQKEDKGEYDEYYDQWESDSEKTVIDSLQEHKSTEDDNSVKQSDKESNKTNHELEHKSDTKFKDKSDDGIEHKLEDSSDHSKDKLSNDLSKKSALKNSQDDLKSKSKEILEKKSVINVQKESKISPKDRTNSLKPKIDGKNIEKKIIKTKTQSKSSDKSKASSGESAKSVSNKSVKTKDNKSLENQSIPSQQNKKPTERRRSISRDKTTAVNTKIDRKSSVVPKVKTKSDNKKETVVKVKDSLAKTSYLSASDMSLNKSTDDQNVEPSTHLKNSISNQDINEYTNEDRNLTNISSEESIFDSSLVMADIERSDSRMYSDIDRICPKDDTECSPLQHIQNSLSPNREQSDECNEFCNSIHKPESRCCHKLHFKTMPAHLGKIEVSHIGSRVDSRRDHTYMDNVPHLSRDRVRRVRRVRPNSDGYKSIDPNIITQTVEKSLRKYQLERKLFEELNELKRFQIRSGKSNEILMVKRLVDKFRREVKAPGMTDFVGNYTYKNYEFYLYDQLRRLSTSNEGKVALLTRSASHENIHLIRNSNENITQSSPELMQNIEGLDTNQQNMSETHEIHTIDNHKHNSPNVISEMQSINNTTEEGVIEVVSKTTHSFQCESNDQKELGNSDILNHFDNELEIHTNCEQNHLDQGSCGQEVKALIKNSTHYQNSELISENFRITEEVSHIVIDSKEESNQPLEQKTQLVESQNTSTKISESCVYTSIEEQKDGSFFERKASLVEIIEKISEIHSNTILNEVLNEQIRNKSLVNEPNFETQIEVQKNLKQSPSLESDESRVTDQVSDAKSTYGSTQSAKIETRSQYSSVSRKKRSRSVKSTNNSISSRRSKERQSFKKECLKPVIDVEPSERAKNRKKFKRLKTNIPPKLEINIPSEEIRNRWKDIKETEMKKVFIHISHKQNDLISGFTLWFELNKRFRENNKSIDSQIDRYINENRNRLQRTHSDSYLNRYKLDSNSVTFDKSIK